MFGGRGYGYKGGKSSGKGGHKGPSWQGSSGGAPAWMFAQMNELQGLADAMRKREEEQQKAEQERTLMQKIQEQTGSTLKKILGMSSGEKGKVRKGHLKDKSKSARPPFHFLRTTGKKIIQAESDDEDLCDSESDDTIDSALIQQMVQNAAQAGAPGGRKEKIEKINKAVEKAWRATATSGGPCSASHVPRSDVEQIVKQVMNLVNPAEAPPVQGKKKLVDPDRALPEDADGMALSDAQLQILGVLAPSLDQSTVPVDRVGFADAVAATPGLTQDRINKVLVANGQSEKTAPSKAKKVLQLLTHLEA